jgi:hypothetical protein
MLNWKRSALLASGALISAGVLTWGAAAILSTPPPSRPPPASQRGPAAAKNIEEAPPRSNTLHEQASSAYHARLFVDEQAVVLITDRGFTTLRTGSAPEEHVVALGPVAVRQGEGIVFWRSGKLRSVSLSGAEERELVELPQVPQHLLASGGRLAWIQTSRQTGASLYALADGKARLVHVSQGGVSAALIHDATVYWVSEARDGSWRIERVDLDGGPPRSTPEHRGRPPSMLAVGRDGVYFYDGPQRGVRRSTFDLLQETAMATQVICSPIAVSSRVVCAHVGGLFELSPSTRAPRPLAAERSGPITAMVATDERAYWVAESGDDRLIVKSIAFPDR